jgi:hypothetical protein
MMKRTEELENREDRLRAVLTEQNLGDDSSNESGPEGHDDEHVIADEGNIAENASWYCTTGRQLTESSWNPYWESGKG